MDKFKEARDIFFDTSKRYIELAKFSSIKYFVKNQIFEKKNPFVVVIGYPGVGKTLLLRKTIEDLETEDNLLYLNMPTDGTDDLLKKIAKKVTNKTPVKFTQSVLVDELQEVLKGRHLIIFVDEAQNYQEEQLEFMRMMSDRGVFKFVLVMHMLEKDSILHKEHFKSRMWNYIEITAFTKQETIEYIQKTFSSYNMLDIADMFTNKNYAFIYRVTGGNIRKINMLMYKIFDIADFYYNNLPQKVRGHKGFQKIIEMSALDLRLVGA